LPTIFSQGHIAIVHIHDVTEAGLAGVFEVEMEGEEFQKMVESWHA
jgi:hypothetical protein